MPNELKKTALYNRHVALGAKIVEFGGWQMPVQYRGIIEEHLATRNRLGLFDVSHMGEIEITGRDALPFIQKVVTQDVSKAVSGSQVLYSVICAPDGGVVDDILIYTFSPTHIFLCVNASNIEKDFQWICDQKTDEEVTIQNRSDDYVQLALQGTQAEACLKNHTSVDLLKIKYYRFTTAKVFNTEMILSRTGYTGEDGFELYMPSSVGPKIWDLLLEKGESFGIQPCGLGARDTLRIEMRYPLYGHELSKEITPLEADLEWVVKWQKGDFIGKAALTEQKEKGVRRIIRGFELLQPGIPRQGYAIYSSNELIGEVTSGTLSPILQRGIGIGFVKPQWGSIGEEIDIAIRSNRVKAKIVETPFVRKKEKK